MLSLFYGAGHVNYAWDGLHYLWHMQSLPASALIYFLKGENMVQSQNRSIFQNIDRYGYGYAWDFASFFYQV